MKALPPQLQFATALALLAGLVAFAQLVRAPVKFEAIKCIVDDRGGGRVIGIARNTTKHLIVLPALEVTYVTKEHPTTSLSARLVLSVYAGPGQSSPFYSGVFHGPAYFDVNQQAVVAEKILEIKSWKLLSNEEDVPSDDWYRRTDGRERVKAQNVKLTFTPGREGASNQIAVQGNLLAPDGSHCERFELTVACYDASNQLVEAFGAQVVPSSAETCIDTFPHPFTGGFMTSLKTAPATVDVQVASFIPCTKRP